MYEWCTSIMWMEFYQGQSWPIVSCFFPRCHSKGFHSENKLQLHSKINWFPSSLKMENVKLPAPAEGISPLEAFMVLRCLRQSWGAIILIWDYFTTFFKRWDNPNSVWYQVMPKLAGTASAAVCTWLFIHSALHCPVQASYLQMSFKRASVRSLTIWRISPAKKSSHWSATCSLAHMWKDRQAIVKEIQSSFCSRKTCRIVLNSVILLSEFTEP